MAKFNEIPEGGNGESSKFGLNSFKFDSFSFNEGEYESNKYVQGAFVFSRSYQTQEGETKDYKQTCWVRLKGITPTDSLWSLKTFLKQFVDVAACVNPEAQETFTELSNTAPEFDESNFESITNFQKSFLTKLLTPVLGSDVNVVLHWKQGKDGKWYLNIPDYKENEYKLPFGQNPHIGGKLNKEKGETQKVETVVPAAVADPNGW